MQQPLAVQLEHQSRQLLVLSPLSYSPPCIPGLTHAHRLRTKAWHPPVGITQCRHGNVRNPIACRSSGGALADQAASRSSEVCIHVTW